MRVSLATILFLVAGVMIACTDSDFENRRDMSLSSGEKAVFYVDVEEIEGQKVLVVDHLSERTALKESVVEREVEEIWAHAKKDADRDGISEALIKYRYPQTRNVGENESTGYRGLLFEAERFEDGSWKLRKVN